MPSSSRRRQPTVRRKRTRRITLDFKRPQIQSERLDDGRYWGAIISTKSNALIGKLLEQKVVNSRATLFYRKMTTENGLNMARQTAAPF